MAHELSRYTAGELFSEQGQTLGPCIVRQILNHWGRPQFFLYPLNEIEFAHTVTHTHTHKG